MERSMVMEPVSFRTKNRTGMLMGLERVAVDYCRRDTCIYCRCYFVRPGESLGGLGNIFMMLPKRS
jgi:hypothetical protein